MIFRFRSVAIVVASAGYAHAALSGDDKPAPALLGTAAASAWSRPALISTAPATPPKAAPVLAGFAPALPSSFFGNANGSTRLLFLSPLSPLRAAWRVATQDLALQTLTALEAAQDVVAEADTEPAEASVDPSAAARRREVLLRQRRKSVLNERDAAAQLARVSDSISNDLELSGLSGRVELLTLPAGASAQEAEGSMPNGAGLVRVSGYLTEDLAFALTGLAAESAATTWRAGAEFELTAGGRNTIEVGAVYGTRFNAATLPFGAEVMDRRSVGAFRLVHAMKLFDNVTTRAGGRFVDAPFLGSSARSIDPEFSFLVEDPYGDREDARSYVRFDFAGDTLFPGLEVVTSESDLIALSEGLPRFAMGFEPQRTWNRAVAVGYRDSGTRLEARVLDQSVTHALLLLPSRAIGAPYVENGSRNRVQVGTLMAEKTFAGGQAQAGVEYGYGRFGADGSDRLRDFHQFTTRFDAYLRSSGTGIAIFHRFHEGAAVANYDGPARPRERAQRYFVELRQDVPFVPEFIGADMALLVSLRNLYYDDVERRSIDEFAVSAPPRRITGGIRVKF
jgi:hypothetical protein